MKYTVKFEDESINLLLLSVSSAVMLGLSFPPFQFTLIACFGFVPYLLLTEKINTFGRFFRYSYFTFMLFVLLTLYWVGGFTHLQDPYLMFAGIALFIWQPLFFLIPASIYYFIRKRIKSDLSIVSFAFIWVTFEWLYALGEFAFPWLTIGNTQTYALHKIQFIDITGVYGLSFWVLTINTLIFFLLKSLAGNYSMTTRYVLIFAIPFIYIAPNLYSLKIDNTAFQGVENTGITVGIVQPNVNPWDKWEGDKTFIGRWSQVKSYLEFIKDHIDESTDMVVLPESSILFNLPAFKEQSDEVKKIIDSMGITFVSGYAKVTYYDEGKAPVSSNIIKGTNVRYDSYNSILMMEPGSDEVQTYSKMRLVPFAERIPYADHVPFLIEPLRWGVGISNWGMGKDSTIFKSVHLQTNFLSMVCYESIFPEFVASFVDKGAEFLVFITNDSWWGNTSGARQHSQYAVLRAIENRRWVVRCANGGISSFIDPLGNMYSKSEMFKKSYLQMEIFPLRYKTFYTVHGDWIARISASITLLILLFTISYPYLRKTI